MRGGREVDTYSNCSSALSVNSENKKRGLSRFSLRRMFTRNSDRKKQKGRKLDDGETATDPSNVSPLPATRVSSSQLHIAVTSQDVVVASNDPKGDGATLTLESGVVSGDVSNQTSEIVLCQSRNAQPAFVECPICLCDLQKELFPEISTCEHRSCLTCLRRYLQIEITESRINIACPACSERFHPTDIKHILNDAELMSKYEEFTLRRFLAMEADARYCPAPDCG